MKNGQQVKITKAGLLNGEVGTITEIRYAVSIKDMGVHYLNEKEVTLWDNVKQANTPPKEAPQPTFTNDNKVEVVEQKKRAYTKRDKGEAKTKIKKEKRAYVRKAK